MDHGLIKSAEILKQEAGLVLMNADDKVEKRKLNLKISCFKWNSVLNICGFAQNGSIYLLNQDELIKVSGLHGDLILDLVWNENGTLLATCSKDCTVKIHSCVFGQGTSVKLVTNYTLVHQDYVSDLVFIENTLITASKDRKIYFWDFVNQKILRSLEHDDWVRCFDVSNEFNTLISGSGHV